VPTTLQPEVPEELVERLECSICGDLEVYPEVWTTGPFDPQVECVVLALDVVAPTRPQVPAHALLGVLFLAQGAHPAGRHTLTFAHQQDKSLLDLG
jgi:hypothetical protein